VGRETEWDLRAERNRVVPTTKQVRHDDPAVLKDFLTAFNVHDLLVKTHCGRAPIDI